VAKMHIAQNLLAMKSDESTVTPALQPISERSLVATIAKETTKYLLTKSLRRVSYRGIFTENEKLYLTMYAERGWMK